VVVVPPTPTPVPPKPVVVVPPKPVPPAPVVVPPVANVQAQLAQRLRQVQCARIDGTVGADRVVHLRGFGGSADELAKLNDELRAMPGVNRVDANVTLHAWPQCEVYLNFADALSQPRAMSAQARGAAGAAFTEGDSLSIELQTPDYPSYLYVTYLQASGEAVHLYWPQSKFPKAIPPRSKITLGGGAKGEPVYRIGGPFGDEIIVVIASASPLFVDELPATATDREYLTSFRKAFLVQPKGGGGQRIVSAVALPLVTKPKN
jgi:hypothetical protein